ncbi:MAG TPA: hypothetical protein VFB12_29585 [Ktedonobacteraceae bacterium]|nr:hypothetical protein [Ktedonobacteraceae bacterium]
MIKCNRCGMLNAVGAMNCQQCGTPLSNKIESGFASRMGAQEQPELPAWLESLRAGERSAAPINNPQSNFSTADLIEEGSLPTWMRSQREEASDNAPSGPQMPAFPVPNTEGQGYPPQGIAAQSLIDEKSLPPWMQEGKSSATPVPPGGITASSLLEKDNMPDWMKTLQQPQSPSDVRPARPAPSMQPPQMAQPQARPEPAPVKTGAPVSPAPSQGFSAHDLIDQQALPPWMTQQNGQSVAPRGNSGPMAAVNNGFGAPANTPANNLANNLNSGAQGFSASSLLDMDALPPWLREGGQEQRGNNTSSPSSAQAAPPYQSGSWKAPEQQQPSGAWQSSQQYPSGSWKAPEQQQPSGAWQGTPSASSMQGPQANGLSGSSFIDMNSLPDWLRSAAEQSGGVQQQSPVTGTGARPGSLPVPPRVENMRVPSRPRGDLNSNESSEVAANVFASMLGVASTAPQYPSEAPQYPPAQPAAAYQQPAQSQRIASPSTGNLPGGAMAGGAQGPTSIPGMSPQGYAPGGSGVYNGYAGNMQGNYQPMASPMMPPGNDAGAGLGMSGEQKNKKRGLVEALRDWLFR